MCCAFITSCNVQEQNKNITQTSTYDGKLSTPLEAQIKLDISLIINQFDSSSAEILKRYLSGNSRWETRRENKYKLVNGKYKPFEVIYAIRKEERNGDHETTLNGYYSDFSEDSNVYQTRVIVSFVIISDGKMTPRI